jgi:outer membrane protein
MKKLLVLIVITVLVMSCSQTKIGYVDVQEVMKSYDAAQAIEASLKIEQETMSKSLDSLMGSFQAKVQEFYKNQARMSASKKQAAEQTLQQENQQLQQQQQQIQQYLQQKGASEIQALTQKVDSTVAAYATGNSYQMILATQGTGQVMYGDESLNITDTVVDILNASLEAAPATQVVE